MRYFRAFLLRLVGFFQKGRRERELAEEIESNLQFQIEDNLQAGMSPQDARRSALLKFGGIESAKEAYRDRRSLPLLEDMVLDLRFALRMLARRPGLASIVILTLALGIGALIGMAAALSVARLLTSMLYGVKPSDPVTLIAVLLLLGLVVALASYFPARRATKVDPIVALRNE